MHLKNLFHDMTFDLICSDQKSSVALIESREASRSGSGPKINAVSVYQKTAKSSQAPALVSWEANFC